MTPDRRKLLLIEPPFYRLYKDSFCLVKFPLGLGYLSATVLRDTSWQVMAYNADFNPRKNEEVTLSHMAGEGFDNYLKNLKNPDMPIWREVEDAIVEFRPSVVGISAKTQNFISASRVAGIVKRIDPKTIVIVGGPHPSMSPHDCMKDPNIDFAVVGEGERTLTELLGALDAGTNPSLINGILFRSPEGKVQASPPRANLDDIDCLPFPHSAAPLVLKDYASYPLGAFKFIFATRGCPYGCEFCGSRNIWSRKVRYRSPANVVEEIKRLRSLGLNSVHFDDDTFGVSKKNIAALCGLLAAECPGLSWSCETTVNIIDRQTVSLMKSAGCTAIQIGVESGNNEMLRKIHKNITIEAAHEAARLISDAGIKVQTFFMAGFPEETEQTLNDTLQAIRKIKSDEILFSVFTPYPGTDTFRWCLERGLVDGSYDVSLYNHQSPENCFTANIPRDRFKILVAQMMREVDALNQKKRAAYIWRARRMAALDELSRRGPLSLFKRAARFAARSLSK